MLSQFIKYNAVGIVNTLVGFSIVFLLMFWGLCATKSNIIGYSMGAVLSYVLNRKYTFGESKHNITLTIKFFTVLLLAYMLNFVTLQWLLEVMNPYFAQLLSAMVYTLSSFILMREVVFR